jgi:hypothetical protein
MAPTQGHARMIKSDNEKRVREIRGIVGHIVLGVRV